MCFEEGKGTRYRVQGAPAVAGSALLRPRCAAQKRGEQREFLENRIPARKARKISSLKWCVSLGVLDWQVGEKIQKKHSQTSWPELLLA